MRRAPWRPRATRCCRCRDAEGKITAAQVRAAVEAHRADATHEHMVRPALVYISHPTELGTLYSRQELQDLSDTCRALGIACSWMALRLGYGLAAQPGGGPALSGPRVRRLHHRRHQGGISFWRGNRPHG